MKVDKYTEQSGLMPRHEWTKLREINTELLEALTNIVDNYRLIPISSTYKELPKDAIQKCINVINKTTK